jgi:hypothetical protein
VSHFKEVFALLAREKGYEGYRPRIQDHTLASADMPEVRDAVARLLLENAGAVLNFSGGSKLMSLGAYQAALALGRPSMFCDVEEECFVNGRTGPLPAPPDYPQLASQFSIGLLMAVQGRRLEDWKSEKPTETTLAFALKAYEIRNQQWGPLEAFNKAIRGHFYGQGDRLPESAEELTALMAKPLPAATCNSEPARQYLSAAATAGLVKTQGPETWRLSVTSRRQDVDQAIPLMTRATVVKTVLMASVLHGAEVWGTSKERCRPAQALVNQALRLVCGCKRSDMTVSVAAMWREL